MTSAGHLPSHADGAPSDEPLDPATPATERAPAPAKTCLGCGARQEPDGSLPCGH